MTREDLLAKALEKIIEFDTDGDSDHGIFAEIAIEALRAPAQGTWMPIETAPKDGTRVLVAESGLWMTCARYWPCNSYWIEDAASGLKLNPPTHWMPAPAFPSTTCTSPAPEENETTNDFVADNGPFGSGA